MRVRVGVRTKSRSRVVFVLLLVVLVVAMVVLGNLGNNPSTLSLASLVLGI